MKQTIKSVGVLSVAKILGVMYFAMGLLVAPLFLMIGLVGSLANKGSNPFGPAVGVVLAFTIPVFYGGMGFVMGALTAFVYNIFAQWLGGVELELQARSVPDSLLPSA